MECRVYHHNFAIFLKSTTYLLHISRNSATCLLHTCCTQVHVGVFHSLPWGFESVWVKLDTTGPSLTLIHFQIVSFSRAVGESEI